MVGVPEILAEAMRDHQAGRLVEAERGYRHVLSADTNNADALHGLGTLALHAHNLETAADLIGRAVRLNGASPVFHANLGEAYRHLGRLDEASACLETALQLQPRSTVFCGMLGTIRYQQGRHVEAEEFLRRVIAQTTSSAQTHYLLGCALEGQGKIDPAAESYRAALELEPAHADVHNSLAILLSRQGKFDEAISHYQEALRADSRHVAACTNLGILYDALGKYDEAIRLFKTALDLDPRSGAALERLGGIYLRRGQLDAALASFARLQNLNPQSAGAANCLANVLTAMGKHSEAIEWFQTAIRLNPRMAEAYNNLGTVQAEQGDLQQALQSYQRALKIDPAYAAAHNNLAGALQSLGLPEEATNHFRLAVRCDPGNPLQPANFLYSLNFNPGYDPPAIFVEHREWARLHADPLTAASRPHVNNPAPDRRLRIGYVSPNFREHAVNAFMEPVLASHDHQAFEIFCYSDVARPDETTARLHRHADQWRPILGESDETVSEMIRRDQIDVLVDLSGHMGDHRMLVFARKPAPVQVTYLGYQNTTGMTAVDYRLTDEYSDPPGMTERYYTERLVRLPKTFFCYLPSDDAPPVVDPPSIARGYVTFGSFNNFSKVNSGVLATWAELLARVPKSRLILLTDAVPSLVERVTTLFAARDVESARIVFSRRRPRIEYLNLIASVDVALDPFPFNGHTTTCDALWQGVPTLTLSGRTFVSRYGGSALAALDLHEWITGTREEYVEAAARLVQSPDQLRELRHGLRDRFRASPLYDAQQFTRHVEAAYRQMWSTWCERQGG